MNKDCVSLEVAKKLQKAGYKTNGQFYYEKCPEAYDSNTYTLSDSNWHDKWTGEWGDCHKLLDQNPIPAPTATQLAEELPIAIPEDINFKDDQTWYSLKIESWNDKITRWCVFYSDKNGKPYNPINTSIIFARTLPDALGLMMVYLLENNLISK